MEWRANNGGCIVKEDYVFFHCNMNTKSIKKHKRHNRKLKDKKEKNAA